MAVDFLKWPLSAIGGVLVIIIFCIFTLASIALYPGSFSPFNNWISDLGNHSLNSDGSVIFNTGCILTGLAMLVLIAGLGKWAVKGWKKAALAAGQACGVLSALALMLIGVFSEGTSLHGIMSITFFSLLFLLLVLTNVALFGDTRYFRWIGYFALLAIAIDVILAYTRFAYTHDTIWEWLAVFSALLWVALLSYNLFLIGRRKPASVEK